MWQLSEANANHRLGAATAAATATDDARPRHGLLAGARRLPAQAVPAAVPRVGLRLVCLRRDRASSSSFFLREAVAGAFAFSSATQVSPFSVSPALAFERADAGGMLGKFGDQLLRHADIVGRLAFDRHVAAERGLVGAFSVPSALPLKQPSRTSSVCAERTSSGELGNAAARLAASASNVFERRNDQSAKAVAGDGLGEGLEIVDAVPHCPWR